MNEKRRAINTAAAAAQLLDMRRAKRVAIELDVDHRPRSLDEVYAVQNAVVAGLLRAGDRPISYKCACTSEIAQQALGIGRPVYGQLLSQTTSGSGAELAADDFTHRVVEAEFGFRLGGDVPRRESGHSIESIAEHIDAVIPAIEIVDYRFES